MLPLGVILALSLAGCAGGPAAPVSERPTASFNEETGGIEGLVVDDEERPIGGASVKLVGAYRTTNTTEEGRFAFGELPPATYLVLAERAGFIKRQVPAEVPLANVTHVKIVMSPVPPPVPYADAGFTLNGHIRGGYAYRVGPVSGNASGNGGAAIPESLRTVNTGNIFPKAGWQTILFEVNWKPASTQSDQLALQLTFPEKLQGGAVSAANRYWVTGGSPPLKWRWDRDDFEAAQKERPNLAFDTFVGIPFTVGTATDAAGTYDVGVYLEQKFTVFATIGYNGPLDANYTRVSPT